MTETKRYYCNECGNYWEITGKVSNPDKCPSCKGTKINRVTGNKRYSRKSRPKVRGSYSQATRR